MQSLTETHTRTLADEVRLVKLGINSTQWFGARDSLCWGRREAECVGGWWRGSKKNTYEQTG